MAHSISLPIALIMSSDVAKISFIKKTLKETYSVIDSKDTSSAVEWLKSSPVEVVILDYKALDQPLSFVCRQIRKTPGHKLTPILLITNKMQKSFTMEALSAGVADFIHEPLQEAEILERLISSVKSKLVSKKMSAVTYKMKNIPLVPENTQLFLHRMLLNDQTLKEISEAKKIAMPLSLLMVQLDNSAEMAKAWGELTLEEIIEALNHFLKQKLRQFDTLISQGRGRFLLMLPKTSQSAATIIAEDIRKDICRMTISTKKKEFIVTVSIGVVSFDKKLSDAAQAYEQFDLSLERVKKALDKAQKKGNKTVSD